MTVPTPHALVVYESMFGNTAEVARAIAGGLELEGVAVSVVEVGSAPQDLPDVDLLVVGAPTHAFSLSRPSTRADAVRKGAPPERQATGLREWLGSVRVPTGRDLPDAAAFDTRVTKVRHLPKAAGTRATHLARRRGLTTVSKPASFLVDDLEGPLEPGELDRAASWGRSLGVRSQEHAAGRQAHQGPA